jgi:RHS repeat-associated protein
MRTSLDYRQWRPNLMKRSGGVLRVAILPVVASAMSTAPLWADVASGIANPYGFQGARLDAETGFYYFRNRYYDPRAGRFLQRDPVWDVESAGGWHVFAGNRPSSAVDPLGKDGDESLLTDEAMRDLGAAAKGAEEGGLDIKGKVQFRAEKREDVPYGPQLKLIVRLDECGRPLPAGDKRARYVLIVEVRKNRMGKRTVWSGSGTVEHIERGETVEAEVAGPRTAVEFKQAKKGRKPSEYLKDPEFHRALAEAEARTAQEAARQIVERLCEEQNRVRVRPPEAAPDPEAKTEAND